MNPVCRESLAPPARTVSRGHGGSQDSQGTWATGERAVQWAPKAKAAPRARRALRDLKEYMEARDRREKRATAGLQDHQVSGTCTPTGTQHVSVLTFHQVSGTLTGPLHVSVLTFHQVSCTLTGTQHVSVNIPPGQWYPDRNTAC